MPTQNFGQSGQIGFVGPSRPGGKDQNKVITTETAVEPEATFFDRYTKKFKNRVSQQLEKYTQERLTALMKNSFPPQNTTTT